MCPFRVRLLWVSTRCAYERPAPVPSTVTAADVARLCVEADRVLAEDGPCSPAEMIDLLPSRALVTCTDAGFVKRERGRPPRA